MENSDLLLVEKVLELVVIGYDSRTRTSATTRTIS